MNTNYSSSFNIHSIRNMTHQPNYLKVQAFIYIMDEIKKLIKNRASQGFYEINYNIPSFVLGYPPYKILDCSAFLYDEFIKQKFQVNLVKQSNDHINIIISWKNEPKEENDVTFISNQNQSTKESKTVKKIKKKKSENSDIATMNFFHKSGYLDPIPVNKKSSIYL